MQPKTLLPCSVAPTPRSCVSKKKYRVTQRKPAPNAHNRTHLLTLCCYRCHSCCCCCCRHARPWRTLGLHRRKRNRRSPAEMVAAAGGWRGDRPWCYWWQLNYNGRQPPWSTKGMGTIYMQIVSKKQTQTLLSA